jgi:hypothetical protein
MGPEEMMKQLLRCQTASGKGAGEAGLSSLISPMADKRAKALKQQLTDDEKVSFNI